VRRVVRAADGKQLARLGAKVTGRDEVKGSGRRQGRLGG